MLYLCSVIKMEFIICLDDNNGMLFNNRRQSRDSVLIADIISSLNGEKLNVFPFSRQLFSAYENNVNIVSEISADGIYFIENIDLKPFWDITDEITVYRWNRIYPSDFVCDTGFLQFNVKSQTEFQGSSHEKITKIVYGR